MDSPGHLSPTNRIVPQGPNKFDQIKVRTFAPKMGEVNFIQEDDMRLETTRARFSNVLKRHGELTERLSRDSDKMIFERLQKEFEAARASKTQEICLDGEQWNDGLLATIRERVHMEAERKLMQSPNETSNNNLRLEFFLLDLSKSVCNTPFLNLKFIAFKNCDYGDLELRIVKYCSERSDRAQRLPISHVSIFKLVRIVLEELVSVVSMAVERLLGYIMVSRSATDDHIDSRDTSRGTSLICTRAPRDISNYDESVVTFTGLVTPESTEGGLNNVDFRLKILITPENRWISSIPPEREDHAPHWWRSISENDATLRSRKSNPLNEIQGVTPLRGSEEVSTSSSDVVPLSELRKRRTLLSEAQSKKATKKTVEETVPNLKGKPTGSPKTVESKKQKNQAKPSKADAAKPKRPLPQICTILAFAELVNQYQEAIPTKT
ncbi:hypothetical protein LguiA_007215 [Lonicera macranthoides]